MRGSLGQEKTRTKLSNGAVQPQQLFLRLMERFDLSYKVTVPGEPENALRELPAVPGFVVLELVQDARNAREVRQAMKLVGGGPMVAEMVGSRPRSVTLPLAGRSDAVAAGEGTYQRYPTGADLGSDRE